MLFFNFALIFWINKFWFIYSFSVYASQLWGITQYRTQVCPLCQNLKQILECLCSNSARYRWKMDKFAKNDKMINMFKLGFIATVRVFGSGVIGVIVVQRFWQMWRLSNPRGKYQLPLSCQVGWSSILRLRTFCINILVGGQITFVRS